MFKVVFLCSGGGGNLRFISNAIELGWIKNTIISGVITDRICQANEFALANDIWTDNMNFSESGQVNLIKVLNYLAPDVIITNIHKILLYPVVDAFRGKLINLHYSLLPAFSGTIGAKPIQMALDYGVKFVGTTVHLVDTIVDAGTPLAQAVIPVKKEDAADCLMDIVFRCGCISLLDGVKQLQSPVYIEEHDKQYILKIGQHVALFNPMVVFRECYRDENFWKKFKLFH